MHRYRFVKLPLTEKLAEFEGGQLFMITGVNKSHLKLLMSAEAQASYEEILKHVHTEKKGDRISYWGGIKGWEMPKAERRLLVHLDWLCVQNAALKWKPIQQPTHCAITMDINFTGYYFPKGGARIKVWTTLLMETSFGEFCRFYKKDDPDRLVWNGEEYVPEKLAVPKLVPAG
ncbi:MAG: hypothetical protein UX89_C0001G0073 [Parcubacteria group bacterium GW2011_GWA2_47_16]|nr:MAG: hypothetical protein UX89_C0001G0073 [Parcubacteria group bacterium GW2011_GWA2_47_16]